MNVDRDIDAIRAILDEGEQLATRWRNAREYQEQYGEERSREILTRARQKASQIAAESLNKAERSVAVATERLHNEERKTADAVDAQRQLAAYQRVQSLTAGARNWQDVQGLIDEAERLGDPYLLRALLDVAVPNLREKTHHEVSPFREYGGQIESLARRSRERLRDLEPDSLKQARGEAESAETYFRELRSRVVLLNDHSKLRGGRGVFDSVLHPRKTIQSVNPETGNMVFTTTGRWW